MQGNGFRKLFVNKIKQVSQSSTSQDLENAGMRWGSPRIKAKDSSEFI